MPDVTQILNAIDAGDVQAASDLLPLVYDELRKLAGHCMKNEAPGHTLGPTALVHEAYIRLVGKDDPGWQNRGHFFAAAAEAMRRILIDNARRKARVKHGGDIDHHELADHMLAAPLDDDKIDLLALDAALSELEREDAPKAQLVKLRYFTGLSIDQAAAVLQISRATAHRWWTYARAFLFCEMKRDDRE
jgi:RNA polymerase sigma factor (TIGR02999 family)